MISLFIVYGYSGLNKTLIMYFRYINNVFLLIDSAECNQEPADKMSSGIEMVLAV